MAKGDTKTNNFLDIAANGTRADVQAARGCCNTRTQDLILDVAGRIMDVEDEVERLENNPDVVDIVATYADLQDYDTSQLTNKDVIRVLQDETHNDESTYYRWDTTTQSWTYIGESKQYTDFVGTDGTAAGEAGLVPAPATTDAGKFLKADGTWDDAGSAVNVAQTMGTSTEDAMSQNAVTKMIYPHEYSGGVVNPEAISIAINPRVSTISGGVNVGEQTIRRGSNSVIIGNSAHDGAQSQNSSSNGVVAIGYNAGVQMVSSSYTHSSHATALGTQTRLNGVGSVALGSFTSTTMSGQVNIGPDIASYGYNNTVYRLLTGLYDPQSAHDAANKQYVDTAVAGAGASTISSTDWSDLWQ